jgi:3-hydroxyacyl-[acyl-carrier-protein] dehydratase
MVDNILHQNILAAIPHRAPFRFIDEIIEVNESKCVGTYRFKKEEFFYSGHFPEIPITPSVILVETMAQIGLIPLGMVNLLKEKPEQDFDQIKPIFTDSNVTFKKVVYPETRVTVEAENIYFRLNRLKAKVKLQDEKGHICCSGILSGLFVSNEKINFE